MSPIGLRRSISSRRFHPPRLPVVSLFVVVVSIAFAVLSVSCAWQERMEQELAIGVNQLRAERGLPPLTADPRLAAIARYRAEDMARNGYFGHSPPDGCSARCLMQRAGIPVAWTGEVIAWSTYPIEQSARSTIDMWRNSPQHHSTIINGCFTRMGAGAAIAANGVVYHVVVFEGSAPGC